jgi:hypothetical protein
MESTDESRDAAEDEVTLPDEAVDDLEPDEDDSEDVQGGAIKWQGPS